MLPDKICFVDIETTGLSVVRDRIIEVGILRIEDNKVVKTYESLINPQMHISPLIEHITSISRDDLLRAPTFNDIKDELLEIMDDCVFVAHNVRFDYGFLRNEYFRVNRKFSAKHFCTAKLSRKLFPQYKHHNLDALIERFQLSCARRHRAFDDAKVIWNFYELLQKQILAETLDKTISIQCKKPSLPGGILPQNIENLPEQSGVYIFYGDEGVPLYVGKSKNIKERVLSHFSNDYLSTKEMNMCQQIKKIDTIVTPGELGALIKESILIKQLQPIYNRTLRISRRLILLKRASNENGYNIVTMHTVDSINVNELNAILGIFRSKSQAKNFLISITKQYTLCEKLLGVEKTNTTCFGYRLNACKGACNQREKPLMYNMRFTQAFTHYKMRSWPFKGPIAIREKNEYDHTEESILIDNWCLIGNVKIIDEECVQVEERKPFDLDIYKILISFLFNPKKSKSVQILTQPQFQLSSL